MENYEKFEARHIGPSGSEIEAELSLVGAASLDEFTGKVVPSQICGKGDFLTQSPLSERDALRRLRSFAVKNKIYRSFIGQGYYGCITPPVIQRNILENPGWYTQYTPYQAEISQGRLEALLNFQTMVSDLTGLPIANASLLDEGTAAAEAMGLCLARAKEGARTFFVSEGCHPQVKAVVRTRAKHLKVQVLEGDHENFAFGEEVFGALVAYPASDGSIADYRSFVERAHQVQALVAVACDLLSLVVLSPPGEFGADIALGSAQRFGVPMGFGGPHAAFFAVKDELKRLIPGRLIGVSKDSSGKPGLRLALQTREQHIRRERATSNICTAQVLLAIMAGMYGVYHGPRGLRSIAERVHGLTGALLKSLAARGIKPVNATYFDTLTFEMGENIALVKERARKKRINVRIEPKGLVGMSLDETTEIQDVADLVEVLSGERVELEVPTESPPGYPPSLLRQSAFLSEKVFNSHHSETEFLRYLKRLEARDLSLAFSMIPLGSCTMKLNATSEMLPITWPELAYLHPYAPLDQSRGYQELFKSLENHLKKITGFNAVSFQPNSGAQGEYAGLLVVRAYHESRGEGGRDVCLIPHSAHGTNPASAAMAGLRVVVVECDRHGNIDLDDLKRKASEHAANLAALMVTYPSTHGVFEEHIKKMSAVVHANGGQVYMDGANLNALVGICRPSDLGADLCHINLHKTFCIPHGGGGPGMGPIAVKKHLVPFLPSHPALDGGASAVGPVASAPWGSALILPISWMYIEMMGGAGLRRATQVAILNANYIAKRLEPHYPVLYRGISGHVAHECILDLRHIEKTSGIKVEDVAKRLMDYGFHAPTVSWPVAGTLMVEPTESESKAELDRFCDAMIAIRDEIRAVEEGRMDRENNPLKNAPHTAAAATQSEWNHPYSREQAVYPVPWLRERKFWPAVGRVDNVYGDKNLVCTCADC